MLCSPGASKGADVGGFPPSSSNRITEDGCQFLPAWNIITPHTHHARAACKCPRCDLVDNARGLRVILFNECDGTGLVVDESRNCRVDIDQQFVNATERRCTSGISYVRSSPPLTRPPVEEAVNFRNFGCISLDRKSTRLNSSHVKISYAVFCLKK